MLNLKVSLLQYGAGDSVTGAAKVVVTVPQKPPQKTDDMAMQNSVRTDRNTWQSTIRMKHDDAAACDPEAETAPACFVAGDEMPCPHLPGGSERCIIHDITNTSACCALCSQLSSCNVWTFRSPTCHLRRSWESSRPVDGPCVTGVRSGTLPTLPQQQTTATVTIDVSNVTGPLQVKGGRMMGCHTDLGYSHQIQGFYSQKLYGESFENYTGQGPDAPFDRGNMWGQIGKGSWSLTTDKPLHGLVAQRVTATTAGAGVANRGFNQEGLSFSSGVGKPYEGYFFARSDKPLTLRVALEDYFASPATELASQTISFAGGNWTQLNFSLSPRAGSSCRGFPADTPPLDCKLGANSHKGDSGHACLQCSGQFTIALMTQGATVDLDYAFLQAGEWGRFKGLPLNLDSVTWLQRGGYSTIRTGGTYVEADYDEKTDPEGATPGYLWKKLRGPPWLRPGAIRTRGGAAKGIMETRGWAIFEAIAMCNAMEIEPVITLHSSESYEDLGDLVDYLFAPAEGSNQWGQLRAQDGHPAPYNISFL